MRFRALLVLGFSLLTYDVASMLPLFGGLLQFLILCAWFVYAVKHTGLAPPPPLTRPMFREMLARPVFREMLALVIVTCFFFLLPKSWPLKTGVVRRLLN